MLPGTKIDHYQIKNLLGAGSYGEVYLAIDAHIGREVALKVLNFKTSNTEHLFKRELEAIGRLNHPHILQLYDYGMAIVGGDQIFYMVMPYCNEGSLRTWWKNQHARQPLNPTLVDDIVLQAASALQEAHAHAVVHRDVKPDNFLVQRNKDQPGVPYLLLSDFGIVKFATIARSSHGDARRGTPEYRAPEVWKANMYPVPDKLQPQIDQYALAIMAYELLTGRRPFNGRTLSSNM